VKFSPTRSRKRPDRLPPSPGREWLAERVGQQWTLQAMADARGVSPGTVRKWLAAAGIERQPVGSLTHQQRTRIDAIATPEWLAARVTVAAVDLGAELGCSDQIVYDLMRAAGLAYHPVRRQHRAYHREADCPGCQWLATCHEIEAVAERLPCMAEEAA
jgi:hypothetical protein